MSKINKKTLSRVSIGPYTIEDRGRLAVPVKDKSLSIRQGCLYDQGMGYLNKPGWPACSGDHAACFGRMGYIPLNTYILNPAFDSIMLQYLAIFTLKSSNSGRMMLSMKEGVAHLVEVHRTLKGYRRLKAISESITATNPWKISPTVGGVLYKNKKDDDIQISGRELRELLADATRRYTSDDANVTLMDIGIDTNVSKPEEFVRGDIPVLPNIMRAPQKDSSITSNTVRGTQHPFTQHYARIIDACSSGNVEMIRQEWMNLIKNGEGDNLKSAVFVDKKAFLRGKMFAKVGGQIARSVVAPNPEQRPDQVGIPRRLAKDISYRVPVTNDNMDEVINLIRDGKITHILHTRTGEYIKIDEFSTMKLEPGKMLVLRELQDGDVCLVNRQPTLHKNSILGFEVYLHDYDTIYIHPSATKSFGMDFDGDEANVIFPYTPMGLREIKELMFVEYNMASLASSSLLVGYHQDVNLGAHMMTMTGTYVNRQLWNDMAMISYETRWKDKYPTYGHWRDAFIDRIHSIEGIDLYSGRSLYSTLLPEDMDWRMGNIVIKNGILISGTLESKSTSGASSSIGMVMYRTYGSKETVSWLNGSYRMLNLYLIQKGITLGFPHLLLNDKQQLNIDNIKKSIDGRQDLQIDTDNITDPVLRARTEGEISQELSNVRETISVEVMNPRDVSVSRKIKGIVLDKITLYRRQYSVYPSCDEDLCIEIDPTRSMPQGTTYVPYTDPSNPHIIEKIDIPVDDQSTTITIDLYDGSINWNDMYIWSMGLFPRIQVSIVEKVINDDTTSYVRHNIDRTYDGPNPLHIMIESGARGNATNAIQIAGIIGQQSFGGGRIPRMLDGGHIASDDAIVGKRSMPCYPFGDNTPISRGFIPESYLQGMPSDRYMGAHVASRENLTSNTDLTPRTGYFERRVRTFTENLRITNINGCNVVTNERGVVVMWDYMLDPSRIFSMGKGSTFVDINFELRYMKQLHTDKRSIYTYIPYRKDMSSYIPIDKKLKQLLSLGCDVICVCDPNIERRHPDVYEYLRDILPTQYDNLYVFTIASSVPIHKRMSYFISMTEYDTILYIPISYSIDITTLKEYLSYKMKPDTIASIDLSLHNIYGSSYSTKRGNNINTSTLFNMLTYGIDLLQHIMIVRTNADMYNNIQQDLLEEMIKMNSNISSL